MKSPFSRPETKRHRWATTLLCAVPMFFSLPASHRAAEPPVLDPLIRNAQADVEAALADLKARRELVDRERTPLQQGYRQLTDDVLAKRVRLDRLREAGRMAEERRLRLERETARLEDEVQFVLTALLEYRRGVETRIHPAERQAFEAALSSMDAVLSQADAATAGQAVAGVLQEAGAMIRRRTGAMRFEGMALDAEGMGREGRYLVIGPLAYFRPREGGGALVTAVPGSLLPALYSGHRPSERRAIAALVEGDGSVPVPVDVAEGAALKRARAAEGWGTQIRKGGVVMIPLLLIGVLSLLIGVWKTFKLQHLRRAAAASPAAVADAVRQQDWHTAAVAARQLPAPLSVLMGEALAHRHTPREYLEELLHERLLSMTPAWESHLGTLAVFGGVAPLLGLLGTVTGMIHTFELVTLFGTGEASLLSGGISEALITTKFGLVIAIPVLVAHAFLVRRLRLIIGALENDVARFLNLVTGGGETLP